MPRRELSKPQQIIDWLVEWGDALKEPAAMTLVGSAGLLWHASRLGLDASLPENSMDVDPVTESDALAWMCYDALIGSEFERQCSMNSQQTGVSGRCRLGTGSWS